MTTLNPTRNRPVDHSPVRKALPATLAALAGLSLAAFPLVRPWGDKTEDAVAMADAFASPLWVLSHAFGMAGFVLLAASVALVRGPARWWLAAGVALILPYFGAETFGLHAVAGRWAAEGGAGGANGIIAAERIAEVAAAMREGVPQATVFGVGLIAIAVAGILLARRHPSAIVLAICLATYLPQFFFGPQVRIAHGLLLLAGALWWARSLAWANTGTSENDLAGPATAE